MRRDGSQKKSSYSKKAYSSKGEYGDDSNEESLLLDIEEKNDEWSGSLEDVKNNEKFVSVKIVQYTKVEPKAWIIDSRCSNDMISDRDKFINLEKPDGGSIKFARDEAAPICGKGSISIDDKHKTDDVYYVQGLRHYRLSMSQNCSKGYKGIFHGSRLKIRKRIYERLVVEGTRINGNVYYVRDNGEDNCLLA
ncbi:uncharacterized protein LOC131031205 [Cryptomeria japonica]|uniref:uncharacterized protein LOC131031205 n=1 Tax=Cryptomeria japonica TaxID=3369 RepID=UPI0027DA90EA|nr:uncharacterized protein LOC131031205 [Cryptomeria japonica]